MLGELPKSVTVHGEEIPINTDFRVVLTILQAFGDMDLTNDEKMYIMVDALVGIENMNKDNSTELINRLVWFVDGGMVEEQKDKKIRHKVMDWEQDESVIFSAVNNVARYETRQSDYIHWWTFLGYFNEIKEGLFSNILMIRQKKAKGKKLEKYEQEFYLENKSLIDLKKRYTSEELQEIERLNKILGD